MTEEDALKKVHKGSIVVYEGATNNICIGKVRTISEYGTICVEDLNTGSDTDILLGEYTRSPEEYFLYDEWDEDDYYLNAQVNKHNRQPTQQEIFWYKLCKQNSKIRESYQEELDNCKIKNKKYFYN